MRGRRRPITTEAIGSAATHPSLRGALTTKQSRGHNMRGASNPDGRTAAPGSLPATRARGRNDGWVAADPIASVVIRRRLRSSRATGTMMSSSRASASWRPEALIHITPSRLIEVLPPAACVRSRLRPTSADSARKAWNSGSAEMSLIGRRPPSRRRRFPAPPTSCARRVWFDAGRCPPRSSPIPPP